MPDFRGPGSGEQSRASAHKLQALMNRPLKQDDIVAVFIDGKSFAEGHGFGRKHYHRGKKAAPGIYPGGHGERKRDRGVF